MRGRFNLFQRQILNWGHYHPYNAMMLWKLTGPLDADRLRAAVEAVPSLERITGLKVDRRGRWYEYVGGQPFRFEVVDARADEASVLRATFEDYMNRPLKRRVENPARFVLVECGSSHHYVGLCIDHLIGDLKTGEMILRRVVSRYRGLPDPMGALGFEFYPPTYRRLYRRAFGPLRLLGATWDFGRTWLGYRRVHRTKGHNIPGLWCSWRHAAVPAGTMARVRSFAAHHGASTHDVFLAALMEATGRHFTERFDHPHRRGIAVGAVADLRPLARREMDNVLGVFLGYFTVAHPAPERLDFADLVRLVAERAVVVRERAVYIRNLLHMQIGTLFWPYVTQRAQVRLYGKFSPVVGGLSTANVRAFSRRRRERVGLLDVIRGPSCGPALPMVMLPTRIGDDLNVTVTFRPLCIPDERLEAILADYVRRLAALET